MTNEIITTNPDEIRVFEFKSAALNKYSNQISIIGATVSAKNIELAKILGHIKTEEAYKEDGFKSVADYAEKTFGIKYSNAYLLANVGERFYNVESDAAKKVVNLLSPTNLAEIASLSDEEIEEAISEGKISKESTQKSLRELTNATKEAKNIKVEKEHNIVAFIVTPEATNTVKADSITYSKFESEYLVDQFNFTNLISKRFNGDSRNGVVMVLSSDGSFAKVVHETPVKPKKPKPQFTKAQLLKMLAEAEAEGEDEDEVEDTRD